MSKIDFKSLKKHATSKMKTSSINIFQTNQNTKGAEVASKINSIELLQKAFQKNSLTSVYWINWKMEELHSNKHNNKHKITISTEAKYGSGEWKLLEKNAKCIQAGARPKIAPFIDCKK